MNNGQSLKIDFDQVRALGNQILDKATEFGNHLGTIQSINDDLAANWKGQDSEKYTQLIAQEAVDTEKLRIAMVSIGEFLVAQSNNFLNTMEANRDAIQLKN